MGLNLFENNIVSFVTRPITAVILLVALGMLVMGFIRTRPSDKPDEMQEGELQGE
jgi:hypothetical protein